MIKKINFFCATICLTACFSADALELKRAIFATNNDPFYKDFWELVAPICTEMGLKPTLAFIAEENCSIDTSIGDVIRFTPLPGVPASLQAQVVRLFLPALYPDDGCIVFDIDMIPISRSYFFDGAKNCPDNAFLVYRDKAFGYPGIKFPMCYVAGKGRVFGSIFNITNKKQIGERIQEWAALGYGWNTDELMLYARATAWEKNGGEILRLGNTVERRLDRSDWGRIDFTNLDISKYIDCHAPRPYSQHKELIDFVVKQTHRHLQEEKSS